MDEGRLQRPQKRPCSAASSDSESRSSEEEHCFPDKIMACRVLSRQGRTTEIFHSPAGSSVCRTPWLHESGICQKITVRPDADYESMEYYVKWKGYDNSVESNSWEPHAHIKKRSDLLHEFFHGIVCMHAQDLCMCWCMPNYMLHGS